MDVLQTEIGKEPPWAMLFADDLVICEHSRAEVELQLERWRETFECHGLRGIPAMVYGSECWAVRKKKERKLHKTEMRMLRWVKGKMRIDNVRNVDIWKKARMYPMAEFLREKRLRWFGHVQRRDKYDATRKILPI